MKQANMPLCPYSETLVHIFNYWHKSFFFSINSKNSIT